MTIALEREIRKLIQTTQVPNPTLHQDKNHYKIRSNGKLICTTSSTRGNSFICKQLKRDLLRFVESLKGKIT